MINRLSDSKFFSYANKKYNFEKSLSKVNWNNYIIPKDFIISRVKNFKSLKFLTYLNTYYHKIQSYP